MARLTGLIATAALCLFVAGCSAPPVPDTDPSTSPSSSALSTGPLLARPTASDGGTAQITETGAMPFAPKSREYTAGFAVTNTSATDLLVRVDVLTAIGDTRGPYETTSHYLGTILPGQTLYSGYRGSTGDVFVSAGAVVHAAYWIPMADLAARGMDAGLTDVTGSIGDLNAAGDRMTLKAAFTSHYTGVTGQTLKALVIFRDATGKLLGAAPAIGDHQSTPPGPRAIDDEIAVADWPVGADKAKSTVTMTVVCCAVVPTPEGIPPWRA